MRAIDKFILHVVHNLFPLNEYSEGAMKQIIQHYKDEAEDLNIQISDEQLKKYIEVFDQKIKSKVIAKGGTDLVKPGAGGKLEIIVPLSKLIKLVTASPGAEVDNEEEEDTTPDVVYREGDITIWNGAKQGNCITYGANQPMQGGSRWCITQPRGSYWGRYRYDASYGYPTFYLVKNDALPDSDKLSFVAVQVLNDGQYKFTNRANNPGMEGPLSWEELNRRIPWLSSIPNLKNILKYIPFSKSEKESEVFKNNPISIKQWMKEPFNTKRQYLLTRSGTGSSQLFQDISNELFISKYLPQYPQIATMIAGTAGIINIETLMKYLDKFSKQDQVSIAKQIRNKFSLGILNQDLSFDLKKYLVKADKLSLDSNQRMYVTKDGQSIVLLTLGDDIKVGIYTEDDEFPNIKLNQRTSKYLVDYPELDRIPLKNLLKLAEDEVISKEFVDNILNKAKQDPNSALIIKQVEGGEIILDSNSFSSYKVDKNGKITLLPFDNEEVQQAFTSARDNESFQQNALYLFREDEDEIPGTIDKDALMSVVNATPYNQRILQYGDTPIILLTTSGDRSGFVLMPSTINPRQQRSIASYGGNNWRRRSTSVNMNASQWSSYFTYLRNSNQSFNSNDLKTLLGNQGYSMDGDSKIGFISSNPPVTTDSQYKPAMNGNTALLINTADPRDSFKVSENSGKLVKANVPTSLARQLLGQGQPAAGQVAAQVGGVARRGRPAGVPNVPQPAAAPAAAGDLSLTTVADQWNLTTGFNRLTLPILRKFNTRGRQIPVPNNRGASARNNILGNAGRVVAAYEFGPSSVYIIRTPNDGPGGLQSIASIVAQPGNSHYIITNNNAYPLGSPRDLLQALQQRNLAEIHQYLVNEYMKRNPEHLTEFKELLRKHINEKKK